MKKVLAFVLALLATGCATQRDVTFDNPSPYNVATPRQAASAIVVIDAATLQQRVSIRSFMAGAANSWEVRPGDMLKQVADIELPQVFSGYQFSTAYREPSPGGVVLQLTVPYYQFDDFRAKITLGAVAYRQGRREVMRRSYTAIGDSQGAKMFWAGAFGMKSAIRQSSLDAYKKAFSQLRADLADMAKRP